MTIDDRTRPLPLAPRTLEIIAVSIILLLAAYLRLNHLDWTEFKQDEAHLSQLAFDMARHGQIPLTGIGASVGIVNPPLAAWLLALPYLMSVDPIVATGFVAALNVLAVAMSYYLAKKLLGSFSLSTFIPIAVTFLFAAAPWAVIYSRKIWAQDLLPPLVIVYVWFGYRAMVDRKTWSLIGHALSLAALIQIHYSALWLIPVSVLWLIVFARRLPIKPLLISGVLFGLAFAPFLIADGLHGWPNINRLLQITIQPATLDTTAVQDVWLMTIGQATHSLAGPQEFQNFLSSVLNVDGLLVLEGLLVLAGVVACCVEVAKAIKRHEWDQRSMVSLMLVSWAILPIALQLSHRTPIFPHYFIILYPVQFLLIGMIIARLPQQFDRLRWIAVGVMLLIGGAQAYQTLALQQFVAARPTPGGAGIPIGYYESIVNQAKIALSSDHAAEIVINTVGADPQVDEYPAIFDFLLNDVPHRFVDAAQSIRVYPQQPNIQIDYSPATLLTDMPVRDQVSTIDLRVGEQPAQIYQSSGDGTPCETTSSTHWANGTTFLSAKIDPLIAGQSATIHVCVRLDQASPGIDYHWTNQLFDKAGKRWAQVDSAGFASRSWRAGDVILFAFQIDLSPDLPVGDYKLRVGQYAYPDVASVPVLDVMNNPQSDAIEIPVQVNR